MKKYFISILAMSALMMVACNKEAPETDQIPEEEPGVEYEFTATLDDPQPETEASIDFASTGKVSWVSTDKIAVWTGSSFVEFSAKTISSDGYTATFSATVSGTPTFGVAYYPASIAGSSQYSVTLPESYGTVAAAADGFPMMSNTVTPGQPVTFKHLGSFLKLTLTGLPSGSSSLVVTSSASLSGTFNTAWNGGAPTLAASSGTTSITVPATSGNNTVYLPVPAGTYGFEVFVKNAFGRNLFRKEASSRTFSRAILKSLKALPYVAPNMYFVTVSSPYNKYPDNQNIPLIQVNGDYYESVFNADMNAEYTICDNYNFGNSDGVLASGRTFGKNENADEWGIVGNLQYASWDVTNPLLLEGHIGNWFYKKGVKFNSTAPGFKFYKKAGGSDDWNRDQVGGGSISLESEATVSGFGSGQGNITLSSINTSSEYDVWINFTSMKVYVVASSDVIPPSAEQGAYCYFQYVPSTGATVGSFEHSKVDNSFDVDFMNNAFCFIGGISNDADLLMTYNGNHIFTLDITVPEGGVTNSWFQFRQQGTWGWYRWGEGIGISSSSKWGTIVWKTETDNTLSLSAGKYTIYVNDWAHYDNKQIKFCVQPKI